MARWVAVLALMVGCGGAQGQWRISPEAKALLLAQLERTDELFYAERLKAMVENAEYEDCLELSELALAQHPDAALVMEQRAVCLWRLDRHSDAVEAANLAVAREPERFHAQLLRGNHYFRDNQGTCIQAFTAYLRFRPIERANEDALPTLKLGLCYLSTRKPTKAAELFELVKTRFPEDPKSVINANNGLCAAYTAEDKYEAAFDLCSKIIQDPRNIDRTGAVWFNLATAAYHLGRYDVALEAVNKFIALQRNKKKGPDLRAEILEAMGKSEE